MAERNSAESYSMHNILVGIEEPSLRDQVRTALKIFPSVRGVPVQRDRLLDLISDGVMEARRFIFALLHLLCSFSACEGCGLLMTTHFPPIFNDDNDDRSGK